MITLKTLKDATAQEVFDQSAVHLLTQKKKAENSAGQCKYRFGKLKCAAGCFIADDEYLPDIEGKVWSDASNMTKVSLSLSHTYLISSLQSLHDVRRPETWKELLFNLAKEFKLNTLAIDNL